MYVRPSAPLSIGGVVDDAIRLYRASFRHTWKLSVGFGLLLALSALPFALAIPGFTPGRQLPPQQVFQYLSSPAVKIGYLLIMLVSVAYYGSLFACEAAAAKGQELTASQAVAAGIRRFPGMLLGAIVFCVAVGISSVLLLIPGIWLWGRMQLWPAALFAEDATAMQALGSSWNLTRDRWWRTAIIIFVALIILYVAMMAVGFVMGIIVALVGFKGGNLVLTQLITLPFTLLFRVLITPALPAILLATYHDCKLRSEGGDLAERAAALSNA